MGRTDPARSRPCALVTGASGGIGLDLARLLAAGGHDLVLVARSASALQEIGEQLAGRHRIRATVCPADLSEPAAPAALVGELERRGIAIDVLINNAGSGTHGPFAAADLDGQLRMLRLNVTALTHLTGLLLPPMLARSSGRILNVASTAAFQAGPLMAVYYASKAYVLHFSEALSIELLGSGVTVTALCPGPTLTGFQKAARMGPSRLPRGGLVMDSPSVAKTGYEGLMRGRPLVIPGRRNRLLAGLVRILPRRTVGRLVRRLNERLDA
jgi:uncharacterized protein